MKTHLSVLLAVVGLGILPICARAQTPSDNGPDTVGPYSVTSSIEVGVRGVKVEGSEEKYRSDLNYQPGFQFLDSSLLLESNGKGTTFFDSLLVKVTGWDSDPSGYLRVNAEKLDLYRLDTTVRRFNSFNSLRTIARGQHTNDIETTLGDVNLILMPQNRAFRINLDYAFDRRHGDSTRTYDYSRDEFPILAPVRSQSDTFSAGFDAKVSVFDISFLQGYRAYKDDATYFINTPQQGNGGVIVPTFLDTFNRDSLARGHSNFSRLNVHTFLKDTVDITGRVVYSNARTEGSLFEALTGANASNFIVDPEQVSAFSNSERPTVFADLGVSVLATDRLTISNTFRFNRFRINGDLDEVLQVRVASPSPSFTETETLFSRVTRYRQFSNTIELDYAFDPRVSAHVGYRYTDRSNDLESFEASADETGEITPDLESFDNRTNTFIFGLSAKPIKHFWTLYFDFERGEADNVFTRVANYDYTSVRIRNRINATDALSFNFSATARNNDNPTRTEDIPPVDFGTSTESRLFSASADWVPNSKYVLSAGYTHSRIRSDSVIVFFFNSVKKQGISQYFMKDNSAYVSLNAQVHPRVGIFGAYRIHNDTGAGDLLPSSPDVLISAYPYRYETPEIRFSVRINDRLDLLAGYQYYRFEERFRNLTPVQALELQDYSAHLPYASLRFYFGRRE